MSAIFNLPAHNWIVFLSTLSCVLLPIGANKHAVFGYEGRHGPAHWAEDFHTCVGKHQSPINIEEHNVKNVTLKPLILSQLSIPRDMFLANNGHTALLHGSNKSEPAYLTGGPLDGTYVFEQLHFHWGENDFEGSEDLINNHSFAMELHAVFYKKIYGSINKAIQHKDGLAVLAYFFEADPKDKGNPAFDDIVESLPKVEQVDAEILLQKSLNLDKLLNPESRIPGDKLQNFFTYSGSLTTPPCSEVVTWIDFRDPLYLSHSQLAAFRNIISTEGSRLTHNFRPVQPLEDRIVYRNVPDLNSAPRIDISNDIDVPLSETKNTDANAAMTSYYFKHQHFIWVLVGVVSSHLLIAFS